MLKKIKQICKQIEKEKNIKILYAVESGSRAWGLESKDSDYDIRFVFKRQLKDYIQINRPIDVIAEHYNEKGEKCSAEGCFFDVCGFDIFKFIKMLTSSNPTVIEWLRCDIIYYGKKNKIFYDFVMEHFNPISLYYHYKSMCRNNYLKYLQSGNLVTYKKYLYAMRGLINAKYVSSCTKVPPINFINTIKGLSILIPEEVRNKLFGIIETKKKGKEKDNIQNIVRIDNYIEDFLKDNSEVPINRKFTTLNILNDELQKIILGDDYNF